MLESDPTVLVASYLLSDNGTLLLQTNRESLQFFTRKENTWAQTIQKGLYEAGFASIEHSIAEDTHRIPISLHTYETLRVMQANDTFFQRLLHAVRIHEDQYVIEFSRDTKLGQHIRHNKDLFIAHVQ